MGDFFFESSEAILSWSLSGRLRLPFAAGDLLVFVFFFFGDRVFDVSGLFTGDVAPFAFRVRLGGDSGVASSSSLPFLVAMMELDLVDDDGAIAEVRLAGVERTVEREPENEETPMRRLA